MKTLSDSELNVARVIRFKSKYIIKSLVPRKVLQCIGEFFREDSDLQSLIRVQAWVFWPGWILR